MVSDVHAGVIPIGDNKFKEQEKHKVLLGLEGPANDPTCSVNFEAARQEFPLAVKAPRGVGKFHSRKLETMIYTTISLGSYLAFPPKWVH